MRAMIAIAVLAAPAAAAPAVSSLVLPQVGAPIHCDGELDETAWKSPARTGAFADATGAAAAPYSDARFLRDDRYLYIALYAADEDVRSSDEFVVELGSPRGHRTLRFAAGGAVVPASAGIQVAVDRDGTLDEPTNDDEEWVVEAAVPLALVPFARDGSVTAHISRCDVTKDRVTRCGAWTGKLVRR